MSADKPNLASVPEVEESIEPPLTATDQADLDSLIKEAPPYHTILEIWRELLKPAEKELTARVQPGWGSRITTMYPQIKLQDMARFRDIYFNKIIELTNILRLEIEEDPESLQHLTPASDAEENSTHYKNLLLQWQKQILHWEFEWDCTSEDAAVELGAISEVHKMFFGDTGITGYLDNIGFQFDETDQAEMTEALNEMKEAQ